MRPCPALIGCGRKLKTRRCHFAYAAAGLHKSAATGSVTIQISPQPQEKDGAAVDPEEAKRRLAAKNAKKGGGSKGGSGGSSAKAAAVAEAKARAAKAKSNAKPVKSEQFPPRR